MQTLPQSLLSSLGSRDFAASQGNHYASRTRQVNISTQANAELTVFTAEGDKVSLMASSAMQAAYASYDYQGRLQGQSLDFHAEELSFGATNEVALLVQGDLNAEELADIQHLVSDIEKIATGFFAGDLDSALVQALDIGDFDSLSRFEATMVLAQQTSVQQLSRAISDKSDAGASQANPITAASVGGLVDEITQMVQESAVAPGKATNTIPTLLTTLFEKLADQHDFDASKRQLAADITSQVAERIKKSERTDKDTKATSEPTPTTDQRAKDAAQSQRLDLVVGSPEKTSKRPGHARRSDAASVEDLRPKHGAGRKAKRGGRTRDLRQASADSPRASRRHRQLKPTDQRLVEVPRSEPTVNRISQVFEQIQISYSALRFGVRSN